ncbi:MAG: hypothetical protein RLZZ546_750, partial [Bacteroidota bacterium]
MTPNEIFKSKFLNFFFAAFFSFLIFTTTEVFAQQTPDITANFTYPEFKITTTPEFPGLCSDRGQSKVNVKCNETYDRYTWKHEASNTTLRDQEVVLTHAGKWKLTVEGTVDGVKCTKSKTFDVFDLTKPEQIKLYFENAGFYAIPIWRDEVIGLQNNGGANRNIECENNQPIKLKENGLADLMVDVEVAKVLSTFKPISDISGDAVFSSNGCLCNEGERTLEEMENTFRSGLASIWTHQYFAKEEKNGFLFIKAHMPDDASLPLASQIAHFESGLFQNIVANNDNAKAMEIISKNVFLAHPIEGYFNESLCSSSLESQPTYITPAGLPVNINDDAIGYFSKKQNFSGALVWFKTLGANGVKYQGFEFKTSFFEGYFDEASGSIYSDFTQANVGLGNEFVYSFANCESQCPSNSIAVNMHEFKPDGGLNIGVGLNVVSTAKDNITMTYIPNALKNANTICFITPTKSVLAIPLDNPICPKLTYFELTYGSFTNLNSFNSGIPSGILYKFIYDNKVYIYDIGNKVYVSSGMVFQGVNPETNDGVVFGIATSHLENTKHQYGLYKIKKGNLPIHQNDSGVDYYFNFDGFAAACRPFDTGFEKISGPIYMPSNGECLHCISDITAHVLQSNTEQPWHIYVDKIGQVATVYRDYFGYQDAYPTYKTFTIFDPRIGSPYVWQNPKTYSNVKFKWEEYLDSHPNFINKLSGSNADKVEFYRVFLEELKKFINATSDGFWDKIHTKTALQIVDHLKHEPQFVANGKPFDTKKKVGLQTLINNNNFSNDYENAIIHLLAASNKESEAGAAKKYIDGVSQAGYKGINFFWNKFDNAGGLDNRTRIITILCSIAGKLAPVYIENLADYIDDQPGVIPPSFPLLESDMLQWKNLEYTIYDDNTVHIENIGKVPYTTMIPV